MPWGVKNPRWGPNGDAVYFHSEGDPRCPMEQAEQVFTALIQQMRVTELIRFPGGVMVCQGVVVPLIGWNGYAI